MFSGLQGHGLMMRFLKGRRVCYIGGHFGSGKTALAFQLANELMKTGDYRYIVSNVKSVWNDDPSKIELREGKFADTVVILDEAGEFMRTKSQADEWISYLRKLRICLILPSARKPARDVQSLRISRSWDGMSIGLSLWNYRVTLDDGDVNEKMQFKWWKPEKIFGVYDTEGFPADEAPAVLDWIKSIARSSTQAGGYAGSGDTRSTAFNSGFSVEALATIEETLDRIEDLQSRQSEAVPILGREKKGRRK